MVKLICGIITYIIGSILESIGKWDLIVKEVKDYNIIREFDCNGKHMVTVMFKNAACTMEKMEIKGVE